MVIKSKMLFLRLRKQHFDILQLNLNKNKRVGDWEERGGGSI